MEIRGHMSFTYEQRASDSPFVRTVWHTQNQRDGCYIASADGCWDIIVSKRHGVTQAMLCGPASRAGRVEYEAGTEALGIRFRVGTSMPHLPANKLLDRSLVFPGAASKSFWLYGSAWEAPNYENVETFVTRLVRNDLLVKDRVVDTVLHGNIVDLSERSVQRRFLRTTGLTQIYIRQIERALLAADLLRLGLPASGVAYRTGYADQAHMTRSLKYLIGYTPTKVVHTGRRNG